MAHLFDPMMNAFCELDEDSSSPQTVELAYDKKSNINSSSGSKHVKWIDTYSDTRIDRHQQTLRELGELQKLTNTFLDEVMNNPGNERVALIWKRFKTDGNEIPNNQEIIKGNNSSGTHQQ